jgi:hypothetical protein
MTPAYGEAVEDVHENDAQSRLGCGSKSNGRLGVCNGPIEDLHAGRPCTVCSGNREISHISDEEMKAIMKSAVNTLYRLLWQRDCDPGAYNDNLALGRRYTMHWDDPELKSQLAKGHARSDPFIRRHPCSKSLLPTCGSAPSC